MNIFSDLNINDIKIIPNDEMKKHTTFGIGGNCLAFVYVYSARALSEILKYLWERKVPFMIIGDGANLLVSDSYINKVFIKLEGTFKNIIYKEDSVLCGAGCKLRTAAEDTLSNGWGGLENIGDIPGTVGGAAVMNAGIRNFDISLYIREINVTDRKGNTLTLSKDDCKYSYKESIFQYTDEYIITSVSLALEKCNTEPLKQKLSEKLQKRKLMQPKGRSAGCIFKNTGNISSGKMIEECGLKGLHINDAYVAQEHANFIINKGNATAADVLMLAEKIRGEVKKQKNIDLTYEVRIID